MKNFKPLVLSLSNETKDVLKEKFSRMPWSPYDVETKDLFLNFSLKQVSRFLDFDFESRIKKYAQNKSNYGVIVIKNLPLDVSLGNTPLDNFPSREKDTYVSEASLCGFSQLFGKVFGYLNEKHGFLVHNICPSLAGKKDVSSEGAGALFPYHVENLNLYPYTPSYLSLLCLRADIDKTAITKVLNIKSVIQNLSLYEKQILLEKNFSTGGNDSMKQGKRARTVKHSILQKRKNIFEVTVEFKDTKALTKEAETVLEKFKWLCNNSPDAFEFKLDSGDMLLIDNRRVLHSRNSFQAYYNGTDRWLQRVYLKCNGLDWDWMEFLENDCIINDEKL